VRFTWDPRKASSNLSKHKVSFEEAVSVFTDPLAIIAEETEYPERAIIIGLSIASRVLVTVFIEVNHDDESEDEIRIISARPATKHERGRYEEGEEN
jgi:hypothetical protein